MDKEEFKRRTKQFAINVARFCKTLPYDPIIRSYIDNLVRASASVAANYRAACRAKSKADFINKMRIVEEEGDESMFFMEMIAEFYPSRKPELRILHKEGNEIVAMVVASINTAIQNLSIQSKI